MTIEKVKGQVIIKRHAGYTMPELQEYLDGNTPWPHNDNIVLGTAVNNIAASCHEMWRGHYAPDGQLSKVWAAYFPHRTQGGGLTGGFVCLYYDSTIWGGKAVEVTVCKHEKVVHDNARPQRGWHPGHCKLCGLDMTVDSSD